MKNYEPKYDLIWEKFYLQQEEPLKEDGVTFTVGICKKTNKVCLIHTADIDVLFLNKIRFKNNMCEFRKVCLNTECSYSDNSDMEYSIMKQMMIPSILYSNCKEEHLFSPYQFIEGFNNIIQNINQINDSLKE